VAGHHFRAGVVAVVRRTDGQVMAFERADSPGHWQLPQGGLERGEQPVEALWRELGEETGLGPDDVEMVGEHGEWLIAEWPRDVVGDGARLGQVHRWFELRVRDDSTEPRPDGREFRDWRWVTPTWLVDNVAAFRQPAYRRALGGTGG
jgi:putative (di)nucleoside polyphosphate hydrolase